jgi:hypothetical protein
MSETMELAVVNAQSAVEIFTKGGLDSLLAGIEQKVRAMPLDVSTSAGRDEIRSVAYKVARTKTALDSEAKKLTEGWRISTAQVNAERKRSQERLDALAEEVRSPLTEFEGREKVRIAAHEAALAEFSGLLGMLRSHPNMEASLLEDHQRDLAALNTGRNWEEFSNRATKQRAELTAYLAERITARKKFDADQSELARLRKEEAERLVRERDERLKAEAAEKARAEAGRIAKEAADAEARRVIEAAQKEQERVRLEAEKVRAEHERAQIQAEALRKKEEAARLLAEKRATEAEAAKKASELKAAKDLELAKEKSRRDSEAAVAKERERIAAERKAEEVARSKREADEKLRAKIRDEIAADLDLHAGRVVEAILEGKIRHVKVIF